MAFDGLKPNTDISNIQYTIEINGLALSTVPSKTDGFEILNDNTSNFKMIINPAFVNNDFNYGSYRITLNYWYLNENLTTTNVNFECNFSILNYTDYFNNINYSSNGDANNNYFFSYSSNELFHINYNYNFYNVAITKVYQQLTYTTILTNVGGNLVVENFDELSSPTTQNYVLYNSNATNKTAYLTFKDNGVYYITYSTINPYSGYAVFENYCSQEIPTKSATVNIFGYQAFYTSNDGLKELKQLNEKEYYKIEQSADITDDVGNGELQTFVSALDENATIARTNQAPVYFTTNATLALDDENENKPFSKYYYFDSRESFNSSKNNLTSLGTNKTENSYKVENYYATPLGVAGIYLVELEYTYSDFNSSQNLKQYFLFEITNTSPSIQINEFSQDEGGQPLLGDELFANAFTNKNVKIQKSSSGVFDSPSVLTVYKDSAFNGHYDNGTIVDSQDGLIFSDTASYKVVLAYGTKDANGNYRKKYTTNFIIDKDQISNIQISTVKSLSSSLFVKNKAVEGLFTNTSVAISWDEKRSGIKTYAEYKFFPTSYSTNFVNQLTSEKLSAIYSSATTSNGIPSSDTFDYSSGEMPISVYNNTRNNQTLTKNQLLTQSGLYIIRIYDETSKSTDDGQFKFLFLDKTTTNLIETSADNNTWSLVKNNKTTSFDHTIFIGAYKLIQFEKLQTTGVDSWLSKKILNDKEYKKNFVNLWGKT